MSKKQKEITVKELNALAKKANRRIRNLEKKGYKGLSYLTLEYDVSNRRAKRFSESNKTKSDMERAILYREIIDFLKNPASTVIGYRKQYEVQDVYDRVRDAINSRSKGAIDEDTTLVNKENFYNFLHSNFFKSQAGIGESDEIIEIYLKAVDKKSINEIYREFRKYEDRLIDLQEVSLRLTGENVFLK